MHARRKGKSGSVKPQWTRKPSWIQTTPEEIEKIVIEKAREGHSSAMIGIILRDAYGIPTVKRLTGKTIVQMIKENGLAKQYPEDMLNLVRKAWNLRKHMENNRKDLHNRRSLNLTESKIRRIVKYYKKSHVLPEDFKYEPQKAPIYLR